MMDLIYDKENDPRLYITWPVSPDH